MIRQADDDGTGDNVANGLRQRDTPTLAVAPVVASTLERCTEYKSSHCTAITFHPENSGKKQ